MDLQEMLDALSISVPDFVRPFAQEFTLTKDKLQLTQLSSLVWDNKIKAVESLLNTGHDVNEKLKNGRTAIYIAVELGHTRMVALLIQHGANVNVQDPQGFTPLHLACFNHQKDIVQLLLSKKADIQANGMMGTPILAATIWPHPMRVSDPYDVVSLLIEHGANVNDRSKDNGLSPLHFAVNSNNVRMVDLLVEAEVDVNVSADTLGLGKKPLLSIAVVGEYVETVKSLLKSQHLDVSMCDKELSTALHEACQVGNLQIIKLLVKRNFDLNALSIQRETPLHVALATGRFPVAEYLLEQEKINVNLPTVEFQNLPLHLAILVPREVIPKTALKIREKVIKTIIDRTNNLNAGSVAKISPIELAVNNEDLVTVQYLIQKGANVNGNEYQKQMNSITNEVYGVNRKEIPRLYPALHLACSKKNKIEMVSLLLSNGAEVNDGLPLYRPLAIAIETGDFEVVNQLLSYGAEVDKETIDTNLSFTKKSSCDLELAERKKINDLLELNMKMMKNVQSNKFEESKKNIEAGACQPCVEDVSREQDGSPSWKENIPNANMDLHEMFQEMNIAIPEFKGRFLHEFAVAKKDRTQLGALVWDNDTKGVEDLLKNGYDVNELKDGRTPIHTAVEFGYTSMVELLIHYGANVNAQDPTGIAPLHKACAFHHKKMVQLLLSKKANVHLDSKLGTPILAATTFPHPVTYSDPYDVVSILIQHGANVNDRNKAEGLGPLHYAVNDNNVRMVDLLIAAKVDVNVSATPMTGKKPLFCVAVLKGFVEIVKSFLTSGSLDVKMCDKDRNTPLHDACLVGNLQIVKLLLETNFDLNALSIHQNTPLRIALGMQHFHVAEYLLQQNSIDVNLPMLYQATLLKKYVPGASSYTSETHLNIKEKVIQTLIDKANNINAEIIDSKKNLPLTTLQLVVAENDLVTAKYLIQKGANVNLSQSQRETNSRDTVSSPLQIAICDVKSTEMVNLLLRNGAEVNNGYYDWTNQKNPLTLGIKVAHFEIVKELQNYGAEINQKTVERNLSLAKQSSCDLELAERKKINDLLKLNLKMIKNVRLNNFDDVKKNIEAGACVNVSHERYGSPLIYASWKGYEDIVDLLLDNSANVNFKSATGFTSLHMACRHHTDTKIVKKLLLHGAYYDIIDDKNKNTPLKYAEMGRNDDACKLLQTIDSVFEVLRKVKRELIMEAVSDYMNNRSPTYNIIVNPVRNATGKIDVPRQISQIVDDLFERDRREKVKGKKVRKEKLNPMKDILSEMKVNEKDNFNVIKYVKNNAGQTIMDRVRDLCGGKYFGEFIIEVENVLFK